MSPSGVVPAGALHDTEAWLADRIDEARLFAGAQVAVVHRGRVVVDLAVGREGGGRPVTPSMQFRAYCAAKPLLAAAVCRAAERGVLVRSAPLGDANPRLEPPLADITIDDLLHHQVPFAQPTGFGSVFIPDGTRASAVVRAAEVALRSPQPHGYGEVASWLLLSQALAWATGVAWPVLVAEHCDDARLPADEVSLHADALGRNHAAGRVGINLSLRNGRFLPLLGEVEPSLASRLDGPGFGPACSARFLARFAHDAVVRRRYGDRLRARTVPADPTYRRDLTFADGLMVGTETLGISDLWPDDVAGHTGIAGMTTVFASPSLDLAVAIHLNGMMGPADGGDHVRPFLTGLLRSELRDLLDLP